MSQYNRTSKSFAIGAVFTSVNEAVLAAADQVIQAYCQDTFSVGGIMLDATGKVLHEMHNEVVHDGKLNDPTAHGERQLVDWYYQQIAEGETMPPPSEITLITSLDPCCMCTGSVITAGFKIVVAAFDEFAGINYNLQANFPTLDNNLRPIAQSTFSYPAVTGDSCFSRAATSAPVPSFFIDKVIEQNTLVVCKTAFEATLNQVQATVGGDLPANELIDPKSLPPQNPLIVALKGLYPQALEYTAPSLGKPDEGLAPYLLTAIEQDIQQGGEGNAVAFLDYFGNLLFCTPGNKNASDIHTPFMLATRSYAQLRLRLRGEIGESILNYLGHPKYGTFVFVRGPNKSSTSLIDLGAYGSTMEGELPAENPDSFQYVVESIPSAELAAYCEGLPPLYSQLIRVSPKQVASQALIDLITAGLPKAL